MDGLIKMEKLGEVDGHGKMCALGEVDLLGATSGRVAADANGMKLIQFSG